MERENSSNVCRSNPQITQISQIPKKRMKRKTPADLALFNLSNLWTHALGFECVGNCADYFAGTGELRWREC